MIESSSSTKKKKRICLRISVYKSTKEKNITQEEIWNINAVLNFFFSQWEKLLKIEPSTSTQSKHGQLYFLNIASVTSAISHFCSTKKLKKKDIRLL